MKHITVEEQPRRTMVSKPCFFFKLPVTTVMVIMVLL